LTDIGKVLKANRGIGPGFDFLRVALALSILAFHTLSVTQQYGSLDETPFWIVHYSLVPMFFALSGFLVSASAGRLSLMNFLINRGVRIVPALGVDIVVCALIIGPIFTTVSLRAYFGSPEFRAYFLNVFGLVHYYLPGVFSDHPFNQVNGSLWTVPFELTCYGIISALIVARVMKTRMIVMALTVSYLVVGVVVQHTSLTSIGHGIGKFISVAFIEHEAQAVTGFLFGIILFQNRDRIPYSRILLGLCVIAIAVSAMLLTFDVGQSPPMRFLLMPALAYITIFVGLTPMPLPKFFRTGDYSYGIYLYHQPILQVIVSLFPALALAPHTGPLFEFIVGAPVVIAIATISWHCVEKPTLSLRKRFTIVAKARHLTDAPAPVERDSIGMAATTTTAGADSGSD
jgi:peptidoglycan/LPS O-acetylase OafA/YrhL